MSYVTPFDSMTRVTREVQIPALDIEDNFFPVDAVSDSSSTANTQKAASRNENNFVIKQNSSLPAVISYKTFNVDKVSTNKNLKQVFPSATKKGHVMQWKTEYYVRNTVSSDQIFDEPIVLLTQAYIGDGNPIDTGDLIDGALMNHYAAVRSLGASTEAIDTVQLDRLIHGGTAPVGLR